MTHMYHRTKSSRNKLNPQGFFSENTYLQMIVYALERVAIYALQNNGQLLKSGILPPQDNPGDEADPLFFAAKKYTTNQLSIYIFTKEEFDERR